MAKVILYRENYFHNLKIISEKAGSKDKVAVVLKDNAYGHGLIEMATLASEFGIKKAVVRNLDEALVIEKLFHEILILADTDIHTYSHTFHITINSLEDIEQIPENSNVHLKVDTGMHRNGIPKDKLKEAIHGISKRNLKFTGCFTHHRSADELSTDFYFQRREFQQVKKEVKKLCEQLFLPIPAFHSCNSSALFRTKNFDEAFARVGIAQYGYLENHTIYDNPTLKPVMALWAKRLSSRKITKGQCVGYGATFCAKEDMTIGCYDIGYGDGFLRISREQNYSTPEGFKLLGRVSMDNLSLDCDKEEVCLFNNVQALAKLHNTLSYEITTTLSSKLPKEVQ